MGRYNYQGSFKCVCGKDYKNSQALKGHQSQCKTYLQSKGIDFEDYRNCRKNKNKQAKITTASNKKYHIETKLQKELSIWISEKHVCEKCGKVMLEKYGSGRFCSRACANSRHKSDITKIKLSEKLRKRSLTSEEIDQLLNPDKHQKKSKSDYAGPELPKVIQEDLTKGFFPRTRMSYAEKFWKSVLDNNNINYTHDFVVQKPKGEHGVFRLDFLVGNIDIEIDGQQHLKDETKIKDIRRTAYLESLGYVVYRIPWINPRSKSCKEAVNKQIDDLFTFLQLDRIS